MLKKYRFPMHTAIVAALMHATITHAQESTETSGIFAETMKFAKEAVADGLNSLQQSAEGMHSDRYWIRYKKGIDRKGAMKILYKSAQKNNAHSQNYIGCIISGHTGTRAPILYNELSPAIAKALPWFEKSANQGHPPAIYNLALIKYTGIATPKDTASAVQLWHRISDKVTEADVHLAAYYFQTDQKEKAFHHARIASSYNDPIGSYIAAKLAFDEKYESIAWARMRAERATDSWYAPAANLMADLVKAENQDSSKNRSLVAAWKLIAIGIGSTGLKNRQAAIQDLTEQEAENAARIARAWFSTHPRKQLPSYKILLDDIPETRPIRTR